MRSLILLSVLFCAHVYAIPVSDLDDQWEEFKVTFDKSYATVEEEATRKAVFAKKLEFIESHNKQFADGVVSHEVDINQFSDWSEEEFRSFLAPMPMVNLTAYNAMVAEPEPLVNADATFDWRDQDGVTPIKNQGQCGGCWAFATAAVVESAILIHQKKTVSLSEQQLIDCEKRSGGCNGGYVDSALAYAQSTGLEAEDEYPYKAKNGACANAASATHTKIAGYKSLPQRSAESTLQSAIQNNGPTAVLIDASGNDFSQYKSGIISSGSKNLNHAVTAVGWGTNYWIIKNSWGASWGENGYFRLARGNDIRGVDEYGYYATV